MPIQVTSGSTVNGVVSDFKDAMGNPTTPKSAPTWATSDTAILELVASADGLSATGVAHSLGTATITATVDGVSKSDTVEVLAGPVADFTLALSAA